VIFAFGIGKVSLLSVFLAQKMLSSKKRVLINHKDVFWGFSFLLLMVLLNIYIFQHVNKKISFMICLYLAVLQLIALLACRFDLVKSAREYEWFGTCVEYKKYFLDFFLSPLFSFLYWILAIILVVIRTVLELI
jgi:hypothetical protein